MTFFFFGVVGTSGTANTLGVGLTEVYVSQLETHTIDDEESGRAMSFPLLSFLDSITPQ
jgi:hypothetical protein